MALPARTSDSLNATWRRARGVLGEFTMGQKTVSVLALVVVVAAAVAFMRVESQPNYQPLFTNLQAADAGAVTAQLATAKIPYELSNGGSTVLVPANLVDQERVALAEQGLPSSGTIGFSNLEKSGITTSQFVQQVEYQQALEGQLAQTIESIQGVQSAQVNLVIPAQSSFAIGPQPATTASILLDLAPGTSLSSGQVQAIVHLTASATPGLSPSGVTVVDNHGDVLSSAGGAAGGTSSSDSAMTTAYDTQLAGALDALLSRVVGPGNAVVQVHALLNFNQQSTTIKGLQTNAKGQPLLAPTGSTTSRATYTGSGAPPAGVLGSNTPVATTNAAGTYSSTSSQVTNAVGQVTQTVSQAPGQVVRTSVAVLLNSRSGATVSQSKVAALVSAAAGLNTANGDRLVVTSMRFAPTPVTTATTLGPGSQALMEHAAEGGALLLVLAAMVLVAWRSSRRAHYDELPVAPTRRAVGAVELDAARAPSVELPVIASAPSLGAAPDMVLAQVSTYIEQRPAEVARLLRAWADEHGGDSA